MTSATMRVRCADTIEELYHEATRDTHSTSSSPTTVSNMQQSAPVSHRDSAQTALVVVGLIFATDIALSPRGEA
jgi:hypothetical protein